MNDDKYSTTNLQNRLLEYNKKTGQDKTDIDTEFLLLFSKIGKVWETYRKGQGGFCEELVTATNSLLSIASMNHIDIGKEVNDRIAIEEKRIYQYANGETNKDFDPAYLPHMADYFMDGMK